MNYPSTNYRHAVSGFVLTALLSVSAVSEAQYNAQWVTGFTDGGMVVDFRQTPPKLTCGANLGALEGTATWNDALTGDIVVYSNGIEVRSLTKSFTNGTGLSGNATATETALFVPVPGTNAQRLFVFSNTTSAVYYSIIDIPTETVLAAAKNKLAAQNTGEGMGAIAHANGIDFWLVVINTDTDSIDSYLITGDPVATTNPVSFPDKPTVSTPFSLLQGMVATNRASIVFSPDGKKLVIPIESNLGIWVFNFDDSTGKPSSEVKIHDGTGYSAAFSPDGSMVYFAASPGQHGYNADVQQYDLTTKTLTPLTTDSGWGGVALGPDGKVYVTGYNKTTFTVISNPNVGGVANVSSLTLPTPCKGGYNLSKQINLEGTQLIPCKDAGVGVQDTGCSAELPVCKGSGISATCVACEDTDKTPTGTDFGCPATGTPVCDATSNTCKAAPNDGSGKDSGTSTDAGTDVEDDISATLDTGSPSPDSGDASNNPKDDTGGCCGIAGGGVSEIVGYALLAFILLLGHRRRTSSKSER